MPWNGSGSYSPPAADYPVSANTLIESAKYNDLISDIATALSLCLTKDGQQTVTADIPFAGYAATNVRLRAIDGTVGLPGISFKDDTDSGLYRIGANNIGAAVNGAKVLDIATTGLGVTGNTTQSGAVMGCSSTTNKITIVGAGTWNTVAAALYGEWYFRDNTTGGQIVYLCDVGAATMTLAYGSIGAAGWNVRVSGGNVQVQTTAGGQEIQYQVTQRRG